MLSALSEDHPSSVVRYSRYLDTYRRYLRDDTSLAKVTITAVYRSSTKYRETAQVSHVSSIPTNYCIMSTCVAYFARDHPFLCVIVS